MRILLTPSDVVVLVVPDAMRQESQASVSERIGVTAAASSDTRESPKEHRQRGSRQPASDSSPQSHGPKIAKVLQTLVSLFY
jgi:hypothetical protein